MSEEKNTRGEFDSKIPKGFIEITYEVSTLGGDKKTMVALIPVSKMLPIHTIEDSVTIYVDGVGAYNPIESYETIIDKINEAQKC